MLKGTCRTAGHSLAIVTTSTENRISITDTRTKGTRKAFVYRPILPSCKQSSHNPLALSNLDTTTVAVKPFANMGAALSRPSVCDNSLQSEHDQGTKVSHSPAMEEDALDTSTTDHDASTSVHGTDISDTNIVFLQALHTAFLQSRPAARIDFDLALLEHPEPSTSTMAGNILLEARSTLKPSTHVAPASNSEPEDADDDVLILTPAETAQMTAILAPVTDNLRRIKKLTPDNLPPPSKYVRSNFHMQILKTKMVPVGECIIDAIEQLPWQQRGALELKLCRHIATEYWPLPISTYSHLRIMEVYRNALWKKALGIGQYARSPTGTASPASSLASERDTAANKENEEEQSSDDDDGLGETSSGPELVRKSGPEKRLPIPTSNYYDCLTSR